MTQLATRKPLRTGNVAAVIQYAKDQLGKPYRWAAAGPNAFDCSGLVMMAYRQIGVNLPHYTGSMINYGIPVTRQNLVPGDLIFPNPHHVQLYVGNGEVIEAPESGIPVRQVPIWGFWQGRRIVNGGSTVDYPNPKGILGVLAPTPNSGAPSTLTDTSNLASASTGSTWVRVGEFVAGALLILVALSILIGKDIPHA